MKFRAIPNTDLVVSEVGLALDALSPSPDEVTAERTVRLAYDEGINLYLVPDGAPMLDAAVAAAFAGEKRGKAVIAVKMAWGANSAGLTKRLDRRLRSMGTDHADLLLLEGLSEARLAGGEIADAIHRLRVSGRVRHAGLSAPDKAPLEARILDKSGFVVSEAGFPPPPGDEGRVPVFLRAGLTLEQRPLQHFSFLWEGTGRTPRQSALQFALAHGAVCSVLPTFLSPDALRELARAPLTPALQPAEITAVREILARFPADLVEA